ncbi:MAG: glycosyltransferase [Firmicutes bacterium HGW-Firmicutes-15]|nr:MAG: glycosyltransferase [Firmicutes bacterium HGW-Firmicutes-15]
MDYEIIIPSHRPQLSHEAQSCVKYFNNRIFDGTGYPSFSKLINDCIVTSNYEKIIICNDKARPTTSDIGKILTMLDEGWGVVAPYRFGFFGFKKDLIRKIGFLDERYIGGGYEDNDYILRLKEADVSYYENEEIEYVYLPTSWNYEISGLTGNYYQTKWRQEGNTYTRRLPEEDYGYDIGPFKNSYFTTFDKSVLLPVRRNLKEQIMQVDFI